MRLYRPVFTLGTNVSEVFIFGILVIVYMVFVGLARLFILGRRNAPKPFWHKGESISSYLRAY